VRDGKVPEALLDRSVSRVLRDKFALGLFDNPYVPENPTEIRTVAGEGADLSRRLAAESVTLLKNEKGLLPKIAIIGPHADDVEAGKRPTPIQPR
jgi:beta-xylosidase